MEKSKKPNWLNIFCSKDNTLQAAMKRISEKIEFSCEYFSSNKKMTKKFVSEDTTIHAIITNSTKNLDLLRDIYKQVFICVFNEQIFNSPVERFQVTTFANMSTYDPSSLLTALSQIKTIFFHEKGKFSCPQCKQSDLSEDGLWVHFPLYHVNVPNKHGVVCPICQHKDNRFPVHLYNSHGPPGRGEMHSEKQPENVINAFSLLIVRRPTDGKYLLVQEFAHSGYWIPGGAVDGKLRCSFCLNLEIFYIHLI